MRNRGIYWFLFGLGSRLQLFGTSLCFTEIFVYVAAIFLFSQELPHMKRNGMMTFFNLSLCLVANALLACIVNHTQLAFALRGMAVVCLIPCAIIVDHWMLRRDMANFKWMLVGAVISDLLSTFLFQKAVEVAQLSGGVADKNTAESIMNGPLWLIGVFASLAMIYPKGWYLKCPRWFSALAPVASAFFALFNSASGRGAAMRSMCSGLMVAVGGKRPDSINRGICKRFWLLVVLAFVMALSFKTFYQTAASSGWLGERARSKYESQTKGDKSIKAILLGGRMESFCGLIACVDKPIVGFGPWAIDENGYVAEFLEKYGNVEDYENYLHDEAYLRSLGITRMRLIPGHAHITNFWLWYGIFGLIFWFYVIFVIVRYVRQDCYVVPQWFFWLAAAVPSYLWNIFLNPFSDRVGGIMFVVACLMVRAVRKGRQQMPFAMVAEIERMK